MLQGDRLRCRRMMEEERTASKVDWSAFSEQKGTTATGETLSGKAQRAKTTDSLRSQAEGLAASARNPYQLAALAPVPPTL